MARLRNINLKSRLLSSPPVLRSPLSRKSVPDAAAIPAARKVAAPDESAAPMIELRNVSYSISVPGDSRARRYILDDVSFSIAPRTINCIMGTSGSGKTTLLRLMAGLIQPEAGEILVFGENIVGMKEREARHIQRRTGFVFQYSALFDSLDVGHNIGFGLSQKPRFKRPSSREIRQTVARLLAEVGLPGIETKQPNELSGGMKKRVAMARALASDPEIVYYDEPDSGLDPVMTSIIDDLIVKVRDQNGTTNVVVTHNVGSIWRIADRVMMVHAGKIVADGTTREVEKSQVDVVQQFLQGRSYGPLLAEQTESEDEAIADLTPEEIEQAEIEADEEYEDFG